MTAGRIITLILTGLLSLTQPCQAQPPAPARIAIILDDIGYNRHNGERALRLPAAVTLAVIPFTPHARALAQQGHAQGRDILLHLPMASTDPERRLDDGGITRNHNEAEIRQRVQAAIAAVPHAVGLNNHMGSQITTDPDIMRWIMDEVRRTPLFFVDSMTNARSVARSTALDYRIPALRRDVFLDNSTDPAAIDRAFERLLEKARQQGYAVAIGHPHGTTLTYLEQMLPKLREMNIELVAVSELATRHGRPLDKPIRLQDLTRWILALPTPAATHLNFSN
jgi:uncharacterized protein